MKFLQLPSWNRWDKGYFLLLLGLCFCFVPTWLEFGLSTTIVPLSAIAQNIVSNFIKLKFHIHPMLFIYDPVYLFLFALLSTILTRGTQLCRPAALQAIARGLLALAVFSASFAPVLTRSGFSGHGGTYSFWTAIPRFFEKYWD